MISTTSKKMIREQVINQILSKFPLDQTQKVFTELQAAGFLLSAVGDKRNDA